MDDDDDTQVYGDALTIAYQSGYYDGKKAAQLVQEPVEDVVLYHDDGTRIVRIAAKRPWVGLTPQDLEEIFAVAMTGEHAVNLAADKLKEKNT